MWGRYRRGSAWQNELASTATDEDAAVKEILDRIPLVPPWTVTEFSSWIESEYQRAVHLAPWRLDHPLEPGEPGACGLLVSTPTSFIISFDETTSERHQRQQIFHEFGHILCGHDGSGTVRDPAPDGLLSAGIDPAMIEYVLYRGVFDSAEERTAELVGTCLAVLSRHQKGHARFDRIASAFYEPIKR